MDCAPDYGLKLKSQGVPPDFEAVFLPFELFALAVNPHENLYTTTSNIDDEGVPHALTLDFDRETFDQTLAPLPEEVSRRIRGDLKKNPSRPLLYEFSRPIRLSIRVGFGEMQWNEEESYLPMRVLSVKQYP